MSARRRWGGVPDRVAEVLDLAMPPLRRWWPALAFGIVSAACAVLLLATSAFLITRASLIIHILLLGIPIVLVRAFAIFRAVFRYLDRLAGHDAALRQLAGLRVGMLDRLVPLAPAGLQSTRRGDLLSRLVDDVDELQFLPLRVVQPLWVSLLVSALAIIGVGVVHVGAGIALAIALAVAAVVATSAQTALAGRTDRELAPLRAALADRLHETLTSLEVLEAYGALDAQLERVREAELRLRRAAVRSAIGEGVVNGTIVLCAGAASTAALVLGSGSVLAGALIPEFLTLIALVPLALFEVFAQVPQAIAAWRRVRVAAERVADVAPAEVPRGIPVAAEPSSDAAVPTLPEGPLDVQLEQFAVRWPGAATPAVDGITLSLPAGTRLAMSGESGAGKTSLANGLVRFLEYTGAYRVGGVEARALDPDELRRGVGLIEQRPHLFADSIRQNLLFARDTASDEELLAVLDRVGLGDWTRERGGLDAEVGERGSLVSGGQAQRIALARALLSDFRVLILDEPTANVDPERADALVRDLVGAAPRDRTVIVISHTSIDDALVTQRLRLDS